MIVGVRRWERKADIFGFSSQMFWLFLWQRECNQTASPLGLSLPLMEEQIWKFFLQKQTENRKANKTNYLGDSAFTACSPVHWGSVNVQIREDCWVWISSLLTLGGNWSPERRRYQLPLMRGAAPGVHLHPKADLVTDLDTWVCIHTLKRFNSSELVLFHFRLQIACYFP